MSAADLGIFAAGFISIRQMMATSDDATRPRVFENAVNEAATYVEKGLPRAIAADELAQIATAWGLDDVDAIQGLIARRFERIVEPDQVPNEELPPYELPPRSNGKDHHQPIPTVQAFPIDRKQLPRRPWLVPGLLLRRHLTVTVAPPGIGKSLLTLQIALLCASALTEWAEWRPRGKYRVLIINVEEDEIEMKRRLSAAAEEMGIDETQLDGVYLAKAETIVIAKANSRTKTVTATPMLENIIDTITQLQIDIVIVDPFAETFEGDENSNSELKWCGVLWRDVARRTNCAVLLVHHAKKYASQMAGDPDAGRGGGSLVGIARIVSTIFTMTAKEADRFDVDEDDRFKYIRFDDAKANLTLVSASARWFEKVSFSLDNAGDGEPSDEVGVLRPWAPKNNHPDDKTLHDMARVIGDGILDDQGRPTGDRYTRTKAGRSNERWAGQVIEGFIDCDERFAKKLLKEMIEDKLLEEIEMPTSRSRGSKRKGLRMVPASERGDMED